jgi:hypothetical protein
MIAYSETLTPAPICTQRPMRAVSAICAVGQCSFLCVQPCRSRAQARCAGRNTLAGIVGNDHAQRLGNNIRKRRRHDDGGNAGVLLHKGKKALLLHKAD